MEDIQTTSIMGTSVSIVFDNLTDLTATSEITLMNTSYEISTPMDATISHNAVYPMSDGNLSSNASDLIKAIEMAPIFLFKAEQIVFANILGLASLASFVVNGLVIGLVIKHEELHTPFYTALVAHILYDLLVVTAWFLPSLYVLISEEKIITGTNFSCLVHRMLTVIPMTIQNCSLAFISVERLMFFYRPMIYQRVFSIPRVIAMEVLIIVVPHILLTTNTYFGVTFMSYATLLCLLHGSNMTITYCLIVIPSLTIILISIACLLCLIRKHNKSITEQRISISTVGDQQNPLENLLSNIKTSVHLITCVSGIYWLTYFPSIIAVYTTTQKFTLQELDHGVSIGYRILARVLLLAMAVSFSCNSIVYLYTSKDLRSKFMKMFEKRTLGYVV